MILGIGNDLLDIRRIEDVVKGHGNRFLERVYTSQERSSAEEKADPVRYYASRFAIKEAFVKALGTGVVSEGVSWQDIDVQKDARGKPVIVLSGGALRHLQDLTPPGMTAKIDVSFSDEYPYGQAFVVISSH